MRHTGIYQNLIPSHTFLIRKHVAQLIQYLAPMAVDVITDVASAAAGDATDSMALLPLLVFCCHCPKKANLKRLLYRYFCCNRSLFITVGWHTFYVLNHCIGVCFSWRLHSILRMFAAFSFRLVLNMSDAGLNFICMPSCLS